MQVMRDGHPVTLSVLTGSRDAGGGHMIGLLGITGGAADYIRTDPAHAVADGAVQTWNVTAQTVEGICR